MITLPPPVQDALAADTLVPRDFLWLTVRDRSDGSPLSYGAWSDLGSIDASVVDPSTGVAVVRSFAGIGAIMEVDPVVQVSGLTVQTVAIRLNNLEPDILNLTQNYDVRRAPVELFRGFLDPISRKLVAPAQPRFVGFVDEAPMITPEAGGVGQIELICASHAQELTRASSAKRSDADQRLRSPTDGFYRHTPTVGQWKITWGQAEE